MMTVNDVMSMFEQAEESGLIEIADSEKLENWIHDELGYQYREEMREAKHGH